MTNEEKLRRYAERVNLQNQDVDYVLGLLRDAKAEAYEEAAQIMNAKAREVEGYGYVEAASRLDDCAADVRSLKDSLVQEPVSSVS